MPRLAASILHEMRRLKSCIDFKFKDFGWFYAHQPVMREVGGVIK